MANGYLPNCHMNFTPPLTSLFFSFYLYFVFPWPMEPMVWNNSGTQTSLVSHWSTCLGKLVNIIQLNTGKGIQLWTPPQAMCTLSSSSFPYTCDLDKRQVRTKNEPTLNSHIEAWYPIKSPHSQYYKKSFCKSKGEVRNHLTGSHSPKLPFFMKSKLHHPDSMTNLTELSRSFTYISESCCWLFFTRLFKMVV